MTRDDTTDDATGGSLAEQAAAWVPPWSRPAEEQPTADESGAGEPARQPAAERPAVEQPAAELDWDEDDSDTSDTSDTLDIAAHLKPAEESGTEPAVVEHAVEPVAVIEPEPPFPGEPLEPVEPFEPVEPLPPLEPAVPTEPVEPLLPDEPIEPLLPGEPLLAGEPLSAGAPSVSGEPFPTGAPSVSGEPLSAGAPSVSGEPFPTGESLVSGEPSVAGALFPAGEPPVAGESLPAGELPVAGESLAAEEVAAAHAPVRSALPGQRSNASSEESGTETQLAAVPTAEVKGALEAILLVVDEPAGEIMLAQIIEQPTERIAALLAELAAEYDREQRGFELRSVAGGWRFYTRTAYAPYVERFVLDGQQVRLTQAALETLAVIAYKQPVARSRISAIRGVNCDGVVRTLLSRGLIEECGSEPDSGAHLYRTTTLFLEKLGLNSVDELPPLAPFLPDDVEALADAT